MALDAAPRIYPDQDSKSAALFERAQAFLPGGNSRHSVAGRPYPIYAASGEGCWLTDVDGQRYLDCVNNMSANIHGHRHPAIQGAVFQQLRNLVSVGFPTEQEIEFAELMCARAPSVERIRFMNSGTEALMFAVRAARAFTGRSLVARVEGAYHGAHETLDVSNHPGPEDWGEADAPATVRDNDGFTEGAVADTLVLPVNRTEAARRLIETHGRELAAIVIDPLISRMGFLAVAPDYLSMLRTETAGRGIVLIFDEVFSFRLGFAGAQGAVGVTPDLTTFGKIIGGGFPVGALGGRADIMDVFSAARGRPLVEHSGTFNANPVTMAAGMAAMRLLDPEAFARLDRLGHRLRDGLDAAITQLGIEAQVQGRGSLWAVLPHRRAITDYRSFHEAMRLSPLAPALAALHRGLVNRGVAPIYPAAFVLSTAMAETEIDRIVGAARGALEDMRTAASG
ncbi:MAG TPA: aspartate aminotransferase family protein [Caulobacteraceae bacterium]|nr:aspartate aminotransferase family protein [Caulobacteraceae bacterium]